MSWKGPAMNGAHDRLVIMLRGRLWVSFFFSLGMLLLALATNASILPHAVGLAAFQMVLNRRRVLGRIFTDDYRLAQAHLVLDIMALTFGVHIFGGIGSGPLMAAYLLIMFYAAVALKPAEGMKAAAGSLVAFFGLVALERYNVIPGYPPLVSEEPGLFRLAALVFATSVIFAVPAVAGERIYRIIRDQEAGLVRAAAAAEGVFLAAGEPLLVLDHEGAIRQANQSAAEFFNIEAEKLKGKKYWEVLSLRSAEEFSVLLQEVLSQKDRVRISDLRIKPLNAEEKVIDIAAFPFGRRGAGQGVFLTIRDMTEKCRMERELKSYSEELYRKVEERTAELEESREIYMSLFEKAAVPLCWLDPAGVLQSANRAFKNLTGVTGEQAGNLELVDLLADEKEKQKTLQHLEKLRKGYDAPARLELEIKTQNGVASTEWFMRFEPLTDQFLVSLIDITDRKRAERALIESESNFRAAVENLPFDFWMMDADGRYMMLNSVARKHWGDVTGKTLGEIDVNPETVAVWRQNNRRAFQGELVREEREYTVRGEKVHFFEIIAPVYMEGEVKAILGVNVDITERKRAEQALKESEERYRSLVEISPDAIILTDLDSTILMVNRQALKLYGARSEDELIGKSSFDYIVEEDRQKAAENAIKVLEQGVTGPFEYMLKRKDAPPYHAEISASVVRDANGEPVAFIGVMRDVTDRKETERALAGYRQELEKEVDQRTRELRMSEERYRKLFESSPDVVALIGTDGTMLDCNRQDIQAGKLKREEIIGKHFSEFMPFTGEEADNYMELIKQWADGNMGEEPLEVELKRPDGSPVWLEAFPAPVEMDGEAAAILVTTRDITDRKLARQELQRHKEKLEELVAERTSELLETNRRLKKEIEERKRAEQEVRQSEIKYRSLFEDTRDAVYMVARDGTMIDANPAATRLLGYTREELIGMDIRKLYVDPRDRLGFQKEIEEKGEVRDFELKLKTKDGRPRDCLVTSALRLDAEGRILGYQGVIRDVTEKKLEQEARKRLSEKLAEAERMAVIGQMAAGVAHEMNNPLTAITYYAQALEKIEPICSSEAEKIQRIKDAARRIQELVTRLGSYAFADRSEFQMVDLNALVRQVIDALAHELEKRPGAEITTRLKKDLSSIYGAPDQLFHLVSNLIINALQSLPRGKGKVYVSTRATDSKIELKIRDNGEGLDPKELPNIFKPFYTSKAAGEGTGLGLAIVERVAKMHNGKVRVNSRPGKGATFIVELPAGDKQA